MKYLFFTFIFLSWINSFAQAIITVDTSSTYQQITGWEVMGWMANWDTPWQIEHLKDWNEQIAQASAEIGINRIRIETYSGSENSIDYFTQYINGEIPRQEWKDHWYDIQNDNEDPASKDLSRYHFSRTIYDIEHIALPLKQAVEARGRDFYLNLCYVDFGTSEFEHYGRPEEYAEYMVACFDTLQSYFGFVPDALEVVLEPDNSDGWDFAEIGTVVGDFISAAGDSLAKKGYFPDFIAPSSLNAGNTVIFSNDMVKNENVLNYLTEISYHKYSGANPENLEAICNLATALNLTSSMLEWWESRNDQYDLYRDLTLGCVSSWQSGIMAEVNIADFDPETTTFFTINDTEPDNPRVIENAKTRYFQQYFSYIPPGSVRIGANTNSSLEVTSFITPDGLHVVVINSRDAESFDISGLPDGIYGVSYSTASDNNVELSDLVVSNGQSLSLNIQAEGVMTIFQKEITTSQLPILHPLQDIYLIFDPSYNKMRISDSNQDMEIAIYNMEGRLVGKKKNGRNSEIDIHSLSSGLYLVRLESRKDHRVISRKFVKPD